MSNFSSVSVPRVQRSNFNLSRELKTTLNFGLLVPVFTQEVLPGDIISANAEIFMRSMPLRSPAMQRANIYTHFFFVPNRLVWEDWQDFITLGEDGLSTPEHPYLNSAQLEQDPTKPGTLHNYLGLPVDFGYNHTLTDFKVNSLPFRAYNLIYNEYYRDQNLQEELPVFTNEGSDPFENVNPYQVRKRAWRHDYFTSCLPFAQKGLPVSIPMTGTAPIVRGEPEHLKPDFRTYEYIPDGASVEAGNHQFNVPEYAGVNLSAANADIYIDPQNLKADLSQVSATTISDLRRAFQLQRFLERNARSGSRYIEALYSQFNVISSDARLQRPEYLGGGKAPLVISEVLQTSETSENSPLGTLGGRSVSVSRTNSFKRRFEEHGWILGIMSVMPVASYMQGIHRSMLRRDALDYAFPVFAHLGEQEVYNCELYYDHRQGEGNLKTFGYQERYAEYRHHPDVINGEFATTLSYWHMGRKFKNVPSLNPQFIECSPSYEMFAYTDEDSHHLISQIFFNVRAYRPLPRTGEPGFIDHF